MHAHLVVAVLQPFEGDGVVEVLGIGGVNGERGGLAEVLTFLQV